MVSGCDGCGGADFTGEGDVDYLDLDVFAGYWLDSGCDAGNDWCLGADLDQLGDVDLLDLKLFVSEWLYYCPYDWPLR